MMKHYSIFMLLVIPILGCAQITTEELVVDTPLIIGYFPNVSQAELDDPMSGAGEGIAHVHFALEDTIKCLEEAGITAKAVFTQAKRLLLHRGAESEEIIIPTENNKRVGIYLVAIDKPAQAIPATVGPSALGIMGPDAAAVYFNAETCRYSE